MVNVQERLARTFKALADPTRRAILGQLERSDGVSISELAEPFAIHLPAVMKHLDVLARAGLVTRSPKSGRTVTVRLRAQPMREAMDWLQRYERFWSGSLDRLASYAERKEAEVRRKADDELTPVAALGRDRRSCSMRSRSRRESHNGGPDAGPVLVAESDPRVGGHYRVRFLRLLDNTEYESSGEYLAISRPERVVMSWRWKVGVPDPGESRVEITLEAHSRRHRATRALATAR